MTSSIVFLIYCVIGMFVGFAAMIAAGAANDDLAFLGLLFMVFFWLPTLIGVGVLAWRDKRKLKKEYQSKYYRWKNLENKSGIF